MAANLVLAEEAEKDLEEAYAWYEGRRVGLGEESLSSVDACIQAICRMPQAHAVIFENFRRALVRRFPYAVFYEYTDETVAVYCVMHTALDPNKWRKRLS
jgi:plasmid stabilization system protein ParE